MLKMEAAEATITLIRAYKNKFHCVSAQKVAK
jgi:hypothetical protein